MVPPLHGEEASGAPLALPTTAIDGAGFAADAILGVQPLAHWRVGGHVLAEWRRCCHQTLPAAPTPA
jgi:hypothetical protein